jgi:hypothetical protein
MGWNSPAVFVGQAFQPDALKVERPSYKRVQQPGWSAAAHRQIGFSPEVHSSMIRIQTTGLLASERPS